MLCAAIEPCYSWLHFISDTQKGAVHKELLDQIKLMQPTVSEESDIEATGSSSPKQLLKGQCYAFSPGHNND